MAPRRLEGVDGHWAAGLDARLEAPAVGEDRAVWIARGGRVEDEPLAHPHGPVRPRIGHWRRVRTGGHGDIASGDRAPPDGPGQTDAVPGSETPDGEAESESGEAESGSPEASREAQADDGGDSPGGVASGED